MVHHHTSWTFLLLYISFVSTSLLPYGSYSLNEIIVDDRHKQTQHLIRMNNTWIPKFVYENIPTARTNGVHPRWNKPEIGIYPVAAVDDPLTHETSP
jgi:hypothetical protein